MPWSAATSTTRGRAGGRGGHAPCTAASQQPSSASRPSAPAGTASSSNRAIAARRASASGEGIGCTASSWPAPWPMRRPGAPRDAVLLQPQGQPGHQQQHLVAHRGQRGVERPQLVPEHPARARRRAPRPARPPPTPAPPAPGTTATASTSAATCSPTTAGTSVRSQACASSSTPVSQVARSSTSSGAPGSAARRRAGTSGSSTVVQPAGLRVRCAAIRASHSASPGRRRAVAR